ncbi:MAG: HD domain-containing protein [Gemmatimonadetes bacterium]|nr:HD domain-containing protein [Gemmatimonadota bacterium]
MKSQIDRAKLFVYQNFERVLVVILVASLLVIHWLIDDKLAFLSFYYLPVIVAGFYLGRVMATLSAVLVGSLVLFFQAVQGLGVAPGLRPDILLTLVPWGGFLILTGWIIGLLSEQRQARLSDLKNAYVSILEVLTFYLEATDRHREGHSHRVAKLATDLARALELPEEEIENLRIAALFHEVGYHDPRLLKLLSRAPGEVAELSTALAMRGASDILFQYSHYYEVVGDVWPVDDLALSDGVKILAVADAFETLRLPSPNRQTFAPWTAVEEIEKGMGRIFATDVVTALRHTALGPDVMAHSEPLLMRA